MALSDEDYGIDTFSYGAISSLCKRLGTFNRTTIVSVDPCSDCPLAACKRATHWYTQLYSGIERKLRARARYH